MGQQTGQGFAGEFWFDPEDPIYRDHFPGRPVVPGSLIVQAFLSAAHALPQPFAAARAERFRFRRFIGPGTYRYRLEQQPGRKGLAWRCSLFDQGQLVASGVLA